MPSYQNASQLPSADVAIIGGGIVGMWTAFYAAISGQDVLLIDKGVLGGGASNGILGALMPHQPINWNDKKQFQLDGLTTLPDEVARLENETGIACGYFRCGRIMPIGNTQKRLQSATWSKGAQENWIPPFEWQVADENPAADWMANCGTHGYNSDNMSARIDPRGLCKALAASLDATPNVHILENSAITRIDADGTPFIGNEKLLVKTTIVTAGHKSFPLLESLTTKPLGWGIKGQSALLKPRHPVSPASPILYDNGTYVVAHSVSTVAVGSTSEREFAEPGATDNKLDQVIGDATILCPALEEAEVVEKWAGVRPRAKGRDPLIGALPDHPNIVVATGGFKITLAIGHIMARSALAAAAGHNTSIPESFRVEAHL